MSNRFNEAQKRIIIEAVRTWPKSLDWQGLFERLDTFAKDVLHAQTRSSRFQEGPLMGPKEYS